MNYYTKCLNKLCPKGDECARYGFDNLKENIINFKYIKQIECDFFITKLTKNKENDITNNDKT